MFDPREKLKGTGAAPSAEAEIAAPETVEYRDDAQRRSVGPDAWAKAARGQNFILDFAEGQAPFELAWKDTLGYVVIGVDDESVIEVHLDAAQVTLQGRGVVTVPSGASTVRSARGGRVARMFPAASQPACELAANAASYAESHPRVTTVAPDRGEVNKLKAFALADFPNTDGRFGSIFRTETLMINFLDDQQGPRDSEKLSPHHHDDFEQGSFTVDGSWLHHIRTPWTKQMSRWRDDLAIEVGDETLTIIPPPTVHTSRAVGEGRNRMIDLFSPARSDFEEQGWVLNAEDYR